jgi:hypothetical protein
MKGYAVEVKLLRWTCSCSKHVDGACHETRKHWQTLAESYRGDFGYEVGRSEKKAVAKFREWLEVLPPKVGSGPDAKCPPGATPPIPCYKANCFKAASFIEHKRAVCFEHSSRARKP